MAILRGKRWKKGGKRGNFHCTQGKKYHFGKGGAKYYNLGKYTYVIHPCILTDLFFIQAKMGQTLSAEDLLAVREKKKRRTGLSTFKKKIVGRRKNLRSVDHAKHFKVVDLQPLFREISLNVVHTYNLYVLFYDTKKARILLKKQRTTFSSNAKISRQFVKRMFMIVSKLYS